MTKAEVARYACFFIFWNRKRWVFIIVTALGAGLVIGDWIRHVWLVAVLWIFICVAILFISGYFNIVRKWLAVDALFEQKEYFIDEEAVTVKSTGSDRVLQLRTIRKVVELREFLVLYGREPLIFIPKKAVSASQMETIRSLLGKHAKLGSDGFTRWIGHVFFGI
jgi:hypothetical protein